MKRSFFIPTVSFSLMLILVTVSIIFDFWVYVFVILSICVLLYIYFSYGSAADLMVKREKCQLCHKELKRSVLLNRVYCQRCETKN